jgi:hypothetical protein
MSDGKSEIVVLADYAKARNQLTFEDVQQSLNEQRANIRRVDAGVTDLLSKNHSLKDIQSWKDDTVKTEKNLIYAFDWLEDKIDETENVLQKEKLQKLVKQCEQFISRNERIKKTIADDMAACRYVEGRETLNPVQVGSLVVSVTAAAVVFLKTHVVDKLVTDIGEAGAALGLYVAFHRQINQIFVATGKAVARTPQKVNTLKRGARFCTVAVGLTTAVAIKRSHEITPRFVEYHSNRAKIVIAAKL